LVITPTANCLTGFAASCVLLSSETTVVDAAKDAMALFFINRLDEDFGKLHTMVGVLRRRVGWLDPAEDEEEDADTAERIIEQYGPWESGRILHFPLVVIESVLFAAAFGTPFFYFACAV
jgi:hypothetical protein